MTKPEPYSSIGFSISCAPCERRPSGLGRCLRMEMLTTAGISGATMSGRSGGIVAASRDAATEGAARPRTRQSASAQRSIVISASRLIPGRAMPGDPEGGARGSFALHRGCDPAHTFLVADEHEHRLAAGGGDRGDGI